MISTLLSRLVILLFGTLYPAYASFKAVSTKNIREYVKWMMYWIVFGIFISLETLSDIFLGIWMPFYYELKILFIFWLISPATQGSSFLYRRCVHPWLIKHEAEIDSQLDALKRKSYGAVMQWGSHGFAYVSNIVIQTAVSAWNTNMHPISGNHLENTISDWYQNSLEKNDRSLLKTSFVPSSTHLTPPSQNAKIVEIPAFEVYPSYSPNLSCADSISKTEIHSDVSTDDGGTNALGFIKKSYSVNEMLQRTSVDRNTIELVDEQKCQVGFYNDCISDEEDYSNVHALVRHRNETISTKKNSEIADAIMNETSYPDIASTPKIPKRTYNMRSVRTRPKSYLDDFDDTDSDMCDPFKNTLRKGKLSPVKDVYSSVQSLGCEDDYYPKSRLAKSTRSSVGRSQKQSMEQISTYATLPRRAKKKKTSTQGKEVKGYNYF